MPNPRTPRQALDKALQKVLKIGATASYLEGFDRESGYTAMAESLEKCRVWMQVDAAANWRQPHPLEKEIEAALGIVYGVKSKRGDDNAKS